MTYGTPTQETRGWLAYLGEGVIVEDPDFPASETADVSVIVAGALDEEFAIVRDLAREVARTLFVQLCETNRSTDPIELLVMCGSEDDRSLLVRYSTEDAEQRLRERGMID